MTKVIEIAKNAKEASISALQLSSEIKKQALNNIVNELIENKEQIIAANNNDLQKARVMLDNGSITESVYNRLKLDENKLREMFQGIKDTSNLPDCINKVMWEKNIAEGIKLQKVICPIGVIGVIFEARPDVISQISSLAIKSSNALILKGGSEAVETNTTIYKIINSALLKTASFPKNMINLIFSREEVKEMLNADNYVDLIIPRGSNSLVKYIKSNTRIPVLCHSDGVCHIYADEFADINKAINVIIDAKCQYPAACNSVETVLIQKNIKDKLLPSLIYTLKNNNVVINSDEIIKKEYPDYINSIVENWHKEYGGKIISLKIVNSIDEAILHINTYGSEHTDCIISENEANYEKFMMLVDSSGVYRNISTRFADGYRYGFGAEVGISTSKIHARGPAGLESLTIYKYRLYGNGDIVEDFTNGKRKFIKQY
ncbi:MAG: glutamate-5-semialdehyde dehydrogenase [Candidatus Gastranaerophilales bacterium]|nr:glutamate-5-semialdehyde dehydrogenase [Candidatus Gastranaerophilales bacterium]